jgi:hypothetical protein
MKTEFSIPKNFLMILTALFSISVLFSCEPEPTTDQSFLDARAKLDRGSKAKQNVVEVTTTHMNLEVQSEIAPGWTTFRYANDSEHNPHFFVIEKMPEGKTYKDSQREIVPLFQEAMNYIVEGNVDMINETFAALGSIEWYKNLVFMGGPGLISPGHTAESTVYLEPGTYTIECYVKDENNVFHVTMGMINGFTVTGNENGYSEPKATMEVNISSAAGITFDENVRPGKQIIKVLFEDQATYANALGHDVHLVKLEENADLSELNTWMNWSSPAGFLTPVPEGVTFLGGMQELPAKEGNYTSQVGFFETRLEPGTYGFIAEVPDPLSKGMLKTFTVPGD